MNLVEFQKKAHETAIYPKIYVLKNPTEDQIKRCNATGVDLVDISWVYSLISWQGEIGELSNKMKKIIRDDCFQISNEKLNDITKEIGDCLWYNAEFCTSLNMDMGVIAEENIHKLNSRKIRNVVNGSGDER